MKYIVVKTTFDQHGEALGMAKLLLEKHLVSCVQISEIDSLYHWKGKIAKEHEFILTMKSKESLYSEIEKEIKQYHSYETPQIIVIPIINGSKDYLDWIDETTNQG